MQNICHFGNNVGLIHSMPMSGSNGQYPVSDELLRDFSDFLKKQPFKYLSAITANMYQEQIGIVLKNNGFKSEITFRSSHGGGETLTLWTKIQKNKEIDIKIPITNPGYNCSVSFGTITPTRNLSIITKSLKDQNSSTENLKRISKTPICYVIQSHSVVEESGKKMAFKKDKMGIFKMRAINY